jgi:hypothetical protein
MPAFLRWKRRSRLATGKQSPGMRAFAHSPAKKLEPTGARTAKSLHVEHDAIVGSFADAQDAPR